MNDAPHARGQRAEWSSLPGEIVTAIETHLGGNIVRVTSMSGGFSPGIAARIETATGQRAFVKAVSSERNAVAPIIHRREILVATHMPNDPRLPVPPLLWSYDEGGDGWVVLVFADIDGHQPAQPWLDPELDRVIEALDDLATALTPSPIAADTVGSASEWDAIAHNYWRAIDPTDERLDPWARRHLDQLAELSDVAPAAVAGETLLHLDLRADNMLLTEDRVYIVDWPHVRIGAAWLDPLFMAPSVTMHGGPDPEEFLRRCASARDIDGARIDAALASVAGFFTGEGLRPEEPGLPGLRAFQEAQGAVARRWLAQRTGWG
jgi:aminoglycoside phosphotransferase (APT) family kinase protein